MVDINDFSEVRECSYKGERYRVRDNGAICRLPQEGKRKRKLDEVWTFGKKGYDGYMLVNGEKVHRIVAFAFHGDKTSEGMVVDHIDTNRCNNRPENLRWLTRLENVLLNEATRMKITYLCDGDFNKFLENPSCIADKCGKDFEWMRTVTKEEAVRAMENIYSWGSRPYKKKSFRPKMVVIPKPVSPHDLVVNAQSPSCATQRNWRTPSNYPCCPKEIKDNALTEYMRSLEKGKVFSTNNYGESEVQDYALVPDKNILLVTTVSRQPIPNPYALTKISIQNNTFEHHAIRTFFTEDGLEKVFTIMQGKKWTGGDTLEDFC